MGTHSTGPETDGDTVVQLPSPPDNDSPPHLRGERAKGEACVSPGGCGNLPSPQHCYVVCDHRNRCAENPRSGYRNRTWRAARSGAQRRQPWWQVDPQTRLRVKYVDAVRRVFSSTAERCSASPKMQTAHSSSRPTALRFALSATAFGVERQPQGIVVTVAEGRVAVVPTTTVIDYGLSSKPENTHQQPLSSKKNGSAQREVAAPGEGPLFLTANQQVTGSAQWFGPEPVREVDSQRELAWARRSADFPQRRFGKVIAQFNRYNRVQLSVTDRALASRPVSGVFNASEPEALLHFFKPWCRWT